jgi:hypothetical protein
MHWAALAYRAGIVCGVYAWRPPLWWVVAAVSFLLAGLYFGHRRWWLGFPIALLALFAVGERTIQVRRPDTTDQRPLALTDGEEVFVTAHVIRSGKIRPSPWEELPQSIDVEVEEAAKDCRCCNVSLRGCPNEFPVPTEMIAQRGRTARTNSDVELVALP